MEQLFSSQGYAPTIAIEAYAALARREFYDGDFGCLSSDFSDLELSKALNSPISITRVTAGQEISYRREAHHIRENRVGIRVIWLVKRGSLKIVQAQGTSETRAGQACILDSNVPFVATLKNDGDASHESYQAVIPPDIFFSHLAQMERFSDPFHLDSPDGQVALQLFNLLVENGDQLGKQTAKAMVQGMLEALADHLRNCHFEVPGRQKLIDRRLADIENYIMMNLTDPELCYYKVAASCRISPRYLCYVLKVNNTSFSELVWKNRLPKARDLLISPGTRDHPIHEIAYMSGFKSAAHFSRKFKASYGNSPREFRAANLAESQAQEDSPYEFRASSKGNARPDAASPIESVKAYCGEGQTAERAFLVEELN